MKHTIIFLTAVLLCACAETPVGRVKALITEGDYEQAIRVLEQVETQRPNWEEEANNFDDYYALGLLSLHRSVEGGKSPLARAVEYFEQAAESDSGELLDLQPIATRYFQIMRLPEPFP